MRFRRKDYICVLFESHEMTHAWRGHFISGNLLLPVLYQRKCEGKCEGVLDIMLKPFVVFLLKYYKAKASRMLVVLKTYPLATLQNNEIIRLLLSLRLYLGQWGEILNGTCSEFSDQNCLQKQLAYSTVAQTKVMYVLSVQKSSRRLVDFER